MANETRFDIRIESTDPSVIQSIETSLKSLNPTKQAPHRDLIVILTVAAAAVSLAKSLIELWKELRSLHDAPPVKVETESGEQLNLTAAKSEEEIEKFVMQNSVQ
jgi:hypothetical protein